MAEHWENLKAIRDSLDTWRTRAEGDAVFTSCQLCDVAKDRCQVCPYYIVYKTHCTEFEGYKFFYDRPFDESQRERMLKGARMCVDALEHILEVYEEKSHVHADEEDPS